MDLGKMEAIRTMAINFFKNSVTIKMAKGEKPRNFFFFLFLPTAIMLNPNFIANQINMVPFSKFYANVQSFSSIKLGKC